MSTMMMHARDFK